LNKNDIIDKIMESKELQHRTKIFAIRIVKLVQYLNEHGPHGAKVIANSQLLRSGTAVAANYRAACRCKSRRDFISKISTVVEEADETQFWLELLIESGLVKITLVKDLLQEAGELTAIMTASKNSAIRNQVRK
jgi:four helix bundle protein